MIRSIMRRHIAESGSRLRIARISRQGSAKCGWSRAVISRWKPKQSNDQINRFITFELALWSRISGNTWCTDLKERKITGSADYDTDDRDLRGISTDIESGSGSDYPDTEIVATEI